MPPAPHGPLTEADITRLQALLDLVPAPLEPLDASTLDGFLCGVLLQPRSVPAERWLRHVTDADGRALPSGFDARPLHALVRRRHAELDSAIERRQWFDPWVFEHEAPAAGRDDEPMAPAAAAARDAVFPWVAGFATAMEFYPGLMRLSSAALQEPLALVFRYFEPDDLDEADDLLALIETLEPPADLTQAVEELVRATLLLADVSRPRRARPRAPSTRR